MRWLGRLSIACGSAWLVAAGALDRFGGRAPPPGPYDAVIVAGAGVRPGGVPSGTLVRRTQRGAELVLDGLAPTLALTGGVGDWGPAEALVAANLARDAGVPDTAIVMETTSRNTEQNALHIQRILGDARVLVVTDRYHAFRCGRVFGRYFDDVETVGVVGTPWPRAWGAVREVAAVAWYGLTGRL